MTFDEWIKALSTEELNNYNEYSKIRGVMLFRHMYESMCLFSDSINYNDLNSLLKYDKKIKDVLFRFLAVIEESIRSYVLDNYDFENGYLNEKINLRKFNSKYKLKKGEQTKLSCLYSHFELTFGELKNLIKVYEDLDNNKIMLLNNINELRNKVMHHKPLLFSLKINIEDIKNNINLINGYIKDVLQLLPNRYKFSFIKQMNEFRRITIDNIDKKYSIFILEELEE